MFAVKELLIVDFERREAGVAPDGQVMDRPFYTAEYDFRLAPADGAAVKGARAA